MRSRASETLSHQFLTSIIVHILAGAEAINCRLASNPSEAEEIATIVSENKNNSNIDIAARAQIPCDDDGTRNVVLFEKVETPLLDNMICGEYRDNERSENVRCSFL